METIKGVFLALTIIVMIGTAVVTWSRRSGLTTFVLLVITVCVLYTTFNLLKPELSSMMATGSQQQLIIMQTSSSSNPNPPIIITATPRNQQSQPSVPAPFDWGHVWPNVARWHTQITQAATHCSVHPALIIAIMQQESAGDPNICSKAGACGLMQLMPGTAAELGVTDRYDPLQNTLGGACYLRKMLNYYQNDITLAVAAYNAGPGNVDAAGPGIPNIPETRTYVRKVFANLQILAAQPPKVQPSIYFIWPVRGKITTQPSTRHMALDIASPLGTPIVASQSGIAYIRPFDADGYGKHIIVDHQNGHKTLYAHLSSFNIQDGQSVTQGQIIGRAGSTGRSTGPHLHFEVRENGILKNPYHYIGESQ